MAIRVVIVDDHPVVREGLRTFLDCHDDVEVVADVGTLADAITSVRTTRPDLVLLDLELPDGSGLHGLPDLLEGEAPPSVLVLTSFLDEDLVRQAVRAGAAGYLVKHAGPDRLLDAIRGVVDGRVELDPAAARALAAAPGRDRLDDLTPRELEVLGLVAQGLSNRAIAERLVVTEKTVKTHVSSILAKLGVERRTQAAVYAKDRGL